MSVSGQVGPSGSVSLALQKSGVQGTASGKLSGVFRLGELVGVVARAARAGGRRSAAPSPLRRTDQQLSSRSFLRPTRRNDYAIAQHPSCAAVRPEFVLTR